MKIWLFLNCFLILTSGLGQSKTPILERPVTLNLEDKLPSVLSRIGKEAGFSFSYNPSIIAQDQIVTVKAEKKTVREVLNEIFKGSVDFREKGNHLILTKVAIRPAATTVIVISGYVEDAVTQQRLGDASVYDKKSITSVVTDEYGYFKLKLEKKEQSATIAISKKNYRDTLVTITSPGNQYLNISISPLGQDSLKVEAVTSSPDSLNKESLSLPYQDEPNVRNISDTLYRDIQISFLPFLGSNGNLSGNVINNYSINLLGGYALGTRQIELGFFVNIDRGDVSWLQIAGLGNIVGGNVYGVQASGFFNLNGGEVKAAQLTGFGNVNFHDFQGVQVAGLGNVNLEGADGVQIAGFANFTRRMSKGVQIAGFSNIQTDHYQGSQFAGLSNIATRHLSGSQISGLFNFGKKIKGTQIGLFNYADSLGGVPVGLVSFVNHGYHKFEISADEVFYTNLAFRTGVRQFYNILMAGIKPEQDIGQSAVWSFGYGIGTAPRLTRWMHLNLDLTAQHVSKGSFTDELSLLSKVHVGVDFRVARKFSLYGGLTLNGYFTNPNYTDYPVLFTNYHPKLTYDENISSDTRLQMWWGAKIGLRFL